MALPDIDRLQKIKSSGQLLEPLDELRLRNHQLRMLRRKWLLDQRLTPREPLVSPKTSFLQRFQNAEEAFWSRNLKHRAVTHYLEEGKNFVEIPKLMLYKLQRGARNYFLYFMIPTIPVWYFFKYKWSQNLGFLQPGKWVVYPGEEQFESRFCDVQVDLKTLKLSQKPDASTDDS